MAHIDAGKTTTTERILFYTGNTYKIGEVHEGTAVMDWMEQEQERGITITSAATTCYLARSPHQHHRYAGPRRLHRRSRALAARARRRRAPCSMPCPASSRSRKPSGARPTSTACRASASSTRWTASAPTSRRRSSQIETKLQGNPVAIQLPIGAEDKFIGVVDLVAMKAITYKDETMGADYVVGEIPADMLDEARQYREKLIEKVSEADDKLLEKYLRGEDDHRGRDQGGAAQAHHRVGAQGRRAVRAGHLRHARSRTRACSRCSTRSSITCRRRSIFRRSPASISTSKEEGALDRAQGRRQGAVRGARVQDHDRPVRRSAHLLPRLFRHARDRHLGAQRHQGQDRAHRPPAEDAREQA